MKDMKEKGITLISLIITIIGGINGEIRDSMLTKCYNKGEVNGINNAAQVLLVIHKQLI